MERSKAEEDAARAQVDAQAPLETVDHERLARLVAPRAQPSAYPTSAYAPQAAISSKPQKAALPLLLIAAVLAVLLIGGGIGAFFMLRDGSTTTEVGKNGGGDTKPDDKKPPAEIKPELIAIAGGTYQMGRTGGLPQEAPPHSVTVASFSMDNTEVTNAEYQAFVNETNYAPPSHWSGGKPLAGQEQWPVTNVSLEDAKAFATWRSKHDGVTYRLPTEEEWEYAARNGDQATLYPWGNQWMSKRAALKDSGDVTLQPGGSYSEGKNRWGVMDLIGNVWEWTATKANYYPGSSLQVLPQHKDWIVIRGGSLVSDVRGDKAITAAYRDWIAPTTKNEYLGFRLVRPNP